MTTTRRDQEQRRKTLRPHPTRDEILDAMRSYKRPISPTRLAEVTGNSLGSTAYHMRTLLEAGVIELADEGRVRGTVEHFYALVLDKEADLNDPLIGLQRLCGALTLPSPAGGYPRPVALDEPARAQMHQLLSLVRPRVEKIVSAAADRSGGAVGRLESA
jgi:DNA-binding transcriptional ArsR family regulator